MPAPHHSVLLQAGCPSCCPTNSVKPLKANTQNDEINENTQLYHSQCRQSTEDHPHRVEEKMTMHWMKDGC